MLIDTHIHLDFEKYQSDLDQVLQRAKDASVLYSICIGAGGGLESTDGAYNLAQKYPTQLFATAGVHPHDASKNISENDLIDRASRPGIVAIGETGFDFHYDFAPKQDQHKWFSFQIELAKSKKLPLIIHSREAGKESLKLLTKLNAHEVGGVFHCYSEDDQFAKKLKDINFLVSCTGTVTFKKAQEYRNIIKNIPLDQLMLETDGPYMSPEPFRGQRSESAHVKIIAETIATIHNTSLETVASITTQNAKRLFKLPIA